MPPNAAGLSLFLIGLRERDEVGRGRYLDGNRQVNSCDFQRLDLDSVLLAVAQDLRSLVLRQRQYFAWRLFADVRVSRGGWLVCEAC